ncbi:MAG: NAD(P)-dependent oxidoreductase [Phycisphaerales bacterium]|jgi:D-3-phosphoglycerate dehydrogenase
MNRPFVLQTEDLDAAAAAWLRESCDLVACHFSKPEFDEQLAKAEGIIVRTYTRVDAAFLDKAPKLRCVARAGVALERIDVVECRRRGIEVVHTPDANSVAVAEYVFALLHDALRPRLFLDSHITPERWNQLRRELEAPAQFSELTLGILGLGRVGRRVARIAAGYGMEVLYHDLVRISPEKRYGAIPVKLPELMKRADIVTVHIDNRPGNKQFVNAQFLAMARPTVLLLNTARGFILDPAALAEFLKEHPGARALLDVHDPEPIGADYPLLGLPNAHLSPHLAASTAAAHVNMSWVVKDLLRVLNGEKPAHPAP